MAISCRHGDADKIDDFLRSDPTREPVQISVIANEINRGIRYVHSIVRQFPERFDLHKSNSDLVGDMFVYIHGEG